MTNNNRDFQYNEMPSNVFLLENRMIKHKTLPFYEVNNILNYDIRRKSNPLKVQMYYRELNVLKPVMQGGNLWDSVKKGFKKIKNVFKKGMDFVDNSEVLKGFKDSALDYIGQKTGVDAHKIYDTAHKVVDALPEWSDVPDPNTDPVDYFNYRQQQYATQPSAYQQGYYTQPSTYQQPYNYNAYNQQSSTYQQPYNYNTHNQQGYAQQTVLQPSRNTQNTVNNQLTNAYNEINKMPTTTAQRGRARANLSALSSGFKSCGEDINTALSRNKTIMNNIPKLLMMGMNASGKLTIQKDFKPILEKFGLKTLTVPKAIQDMVSKYKIQIAPHDIASAVQQAKGPYVGPNQARVQTLASNNKLASTLNNSINKINANKTDKQDTSKGRLNLGRGDEKSEGRLNLGRGNEVGGKSSRYADIIAKLKK